MLQKGQDTGWKVANGFNKDVPHQHPSQFWCRVGCTSPNATEV